MAKFAYDNTKNINVDHTPIAQRGYRAPSKSRLASKLADKLKKLIEVCCYNLLYVQELQKRVHNKGVKSCSYAPGEKVQLNSKYITTKQNKKLENKFFGPFRVFYAVGRHAYKLQLLNVFYMSLLEQDTIRKERVNNTALSEPKKEFKTKNNKEYKVEVIIDSVVYIKETNNQMSDL